MTTAPPVRPLLPDHPCADFIVRFPFNAESGRVGLQLIPAALLEAVTVRRGGIGDLPYIAAMPGAGNPPAFVIDPLAQAKLVGDPYPGAFAQGHTLRNSPTMDGFRFAGQETISEGARTTIITMLANAAGCRLEHRASWFAGDRALEIATVFHNGSAAPVTLEMFGSFSLGGITPFDAADAPGRLRVHRFRSAWSAEGRLETQSIEALHLERSWSGAGGVQ